MTDNPNFSPYVAEALKRAQLPISVTYDLKFGDYIIAYGTPSHGQKCYLYCGSHQVAREYISLLREQQQVR